MALDMQWKIFGVVGLIVLFLVIAMQFSGGGGQCADAQESFENYVKERPEAYELYKKRDSDPKFVPDIASPHYLEYLEILQEDMIASAQCVDWSK
jgi:hypothetical protein